MESGFWLDVSSGHTYIGILAYEPSNLSHVELIDRLYMIKGQREMDSSLWRRWAQPVVMVVGSPLAEQQCRARYGKSLAQVLGPVAEEQCRQRPLSVRTGSEHSRRFVSTFSAVAFVDAAQVKRRPLEEAQAGLNAVLGTAELDMNGDGVCDALDGRMYSSGKRRAAPWFDAYRERFLDALRFGEAELLHQPVCLVFVVSAGDESPANEMSRLRSTRSLPPAFQTGHFSPEVLRLHLVLADAGGDPTQHSAALSSVVQSLPGGENSCRLLPLELSCDVNDDEVAPPSGPDHSALGELVHYTLEAVKEFAELRFAFLSSKVNATRKGFKNQFKNFFSRRDAKKETPRNQRSSPARQGGPRYALESIESQVRQLADLAFVFQDYNLACSNYKLIASDYKADKAQLHLASAQEMYAMCLALRGDRDTRDVQQAFDVAYHGYCKCADIPRATRVTLWAVDYLRHTNPKEAVTVLIRASEREQKDAVRAALLYEQAAYVHLSMKPEARIRKYAFHLIMAGHLFHKANLLRYRIRCYQSAAAVYRGRKWFLIDDHILYHLGKDCYALRFFGEAVRHFVALIGTIAFDNHRHSIVGKHEQPVERQRLWLEEFTLIVSQWEGDGKREEGGETNPKPESISLDLPVFLDGSVEVLEDAGTVPAAYAQAAWSAVDRMNPVLNMAAAACNTPLFLFEDKYYSEEQRCRAVRERIEVKVQVKNPLQVEITAKRIMLRCKYREVEEADSDTHSTAGVGEQAKEYDCDSQDVTLLPGASAWVLVGVVCEKEGVLDIEGVTWTVNDVVHGFHRFNLPPKRMLVDKGSRKVALERINFDLSIPIVSALPRLGVEFSGVPNTMLQGECVAATVRFRNDGEVALHHIVARVSHPGFMMFDGRVEVDSALRTPYGYDWGSGLVTFEFPLSPGESVELPVSLRAAVAGPQRLDLLFQYRPVDAGKTESKFCAEKFRIARWQHELLVAPMFRVKLFSRVSFSEVDSSTIGVEVQHRDSRDAKRGPAVKVHSMAVSSGLWQTQLLVAPGGDGLLASGESRTFFIKASEAGPQSSRVPSAEGSSAIFSSILRPNHTVSKALMEQLKSADPQTRLVSVLRLCDEKKGKSDGAHFVETHPVSHLLQMEKELLVDAERSKLILNPNAEVKDYCGANKVDLVIYWELPGGEGGAAPRHGYHHVIGADCMKSEASRCPVDVLAEYQGEVQHDFLAGTPLSVPVVFSIRNALEAKPVDFVFETLLPEETYEASARRVTRLPLDSTDANYFWQGVTKKTTRDLQPRASTMVRLAAVFHEPGVYALNRFRITIQGEKKSSSRLFFFPAQNLIRVKQSKFTMD
jgi:hypothetical protein